LKQYRVTIKAMRKTRVLLLIPNLGTGGAQKVYRQQLSLLSKRFDVMGCVFNRDGFLPEDHDANLYSLGVSGGGNVISKVVFFLRRILRLRELKQRLAIDVCISHLEGADYVNLFSRKHDRVIFWVHGTKTFDQNISGRLGWIRKSILIPFAYQRSDFLVAVNTRIKEELMIDYRVPEANVTTIYNSFELGSIRLESNQDLDASFEHLMAGNIIITHCRLAKEKNLVTLLKIFKAVRGSIDARLLILGDGELRQELIQSARELQLRTFDVWSQTTPTTYLPEVCFLGYQPNPYRFLSKATVYLMTSLWEGFPLALCEAMACGLPVISTDCYTGPREILHPSCDLPLPSPVILRGEYGILLPMIAVNDLVGIEECSKEVINLLADRNLRVHYSDKARERVKNFDSDKTFEEIFALVDQVARSRKR
jgi:glycosyltransferase involved in cell wall biosynthesis